ncbi:thermonuclease family protein [Candidatus Nanohalovita haloferacivicina]|uniref:thermonuclease family protein n=1 Tax=Candidatus Nanohalovita haloferacivicina TaxID=2978046 RepID=UPI00325FA5B8
MAEILSLQTLAILFLIAITGLNLHSPQKSEHFNATLISITDGDTIDIQINGRNDTVRLLGVDTPETHSSNNPKEFGLQDTAENRACLEIYGEEAAEYLERNLDSSIRVETDPSADRRGSYGRLLAYVYSDNTSINKQLLEKGLARVYTGEFTREKEYLRIEKEAKEKEKGLWSCPNAVAR